MSSRKQVKGKSTATYKNTKTRDASPKPKATLHKVHVEVSEESSESSEIVELQPQSSSSEVSHKEQSSSSNEASEGESLDQPSTIIWVCRVTVYKGLQRYPEFIECRYSWGYESWKAAAAMLNIKKRSFNLDRPGEMPPIKCSDCNNDGKESSSQSLFSYHSYYCPIKQRQLAVEFEIFPILVFF